MIFIRTLNISELKVYDFRELRLSSRELKTVGFRELIAVSNHCGVVEFFDVVLLSLLFGKAKRNEVKSKNPKSKFSEKSLLQKRFFTTFRMTSVLNFRSI
jgi:hypothetical protein